MRIVSTDWGSVVIDLESGGAPAVEMTPDEARRVAIELRAHADMADAVRRSQNDATRKALAGATRGLR